MSTLRRTVLATAVISTGLLSSAGMAFAGDNPSGDSWGHEHGHHHGDHWGHDHGTTVQKGLINSSDFAPNTPLNACNNNVPVNAGGGQVPIQDNVLSLPFLSDAGHGNAAASAKSCAAPIDAVN